MMIAFLIGALVLLTLLQINGYEVKATNEKLTELIYKVAQSEADDRDIKAWIGQHVRKTGL